MRKVVIFLLATVLLGTVSFVSVTDLRPIAFEVPAHFPKPVYDFKQYPLTKAKISLGRTLFYDPILSIDGTVSCGSCHQQASAFTQHGHRLSHGINDSLTDHNSMPLMNLAWHDKFGWDGGIHTLELFPVSPLQHPHEMGENLANLQHKLRNNESYRNQFLNAFADDRVSSEHLLEALTQFMLTMVSADSRYDKFMRKENETFSKEELKGLVLFEQKCASCHAGVLFTDLSLRNNGLPVINSLDVGMEKISQRPTDRNKFKVPSLRNVAVTAPYMHDGRFNTLEEVLDHYSGGVAASLTLDPLLKSSQKRGIPLSKTDKALLIQFLHTLTDEQFLTDERFSEPETEAMYLQKIDFPSATIAASIPLQLKPVIQLLTQIQTATQTGDPIRVSEAAVQLKQVLQQVNIEAMNETQRSFYQEQVVSMHLDADHIIRIKEIPHQKQHVATLAKKAELLSFAFKLNN
jgi:cytochrome c peroxidase